MDRKTKLFKRFYRMQSLQDMMTTLDRGEQAKLENQWTLEISWEAANKVGGVYTVTRSKAFVSTEEMGDTYCLLGPYKEQTAHIEVELGDFSRDNPLQITANKLRKQGFSVKVGRWLVDGNPQIVLFDLASATSKVSEWKKEIWGKTGIGIPPTDVECNDAVIFGYLCAQFIAELRRVTEKQGRDKPPQIVAHFHEWLTAIGLIVLRLCNVDVATVFTAHSTLLGKSLCSGGTSNFYSNLEKIDTGEEAVGRQIYHRYCMERVASVMSHVFTTVSEITGLEAEHLFKRKPDFVTPNGLNVRKFTALHEFQNLHAVSKEKINEFVRGHFYGHYDFDLDKTLYFFIAGRYEFENKGADIFIESLARLNQNLKDSGSDKTIVAFFIFPCQTKNFNVESLRGQALTKSLRDTIQSIQDDVGKRLYDICLSGRLPEDDELLQENDLVKIKRCIFSLQRNSLPPVTTHNVVEESKDPILSALRRVNLLNSVNDRVKVIFHPEFISTTNPLFGLDYEEFVRGCHLGVFPSYYEPWGFTAAECTVLGIPSVTTNLSGFGSFMAEHVTDPQSYGIYIVDRRNNGFEECVKQLAKYLQEFSMLSRRQRIVQRNRTERLSDLLDWHSLAVYYRQARMKALKIVYPEIEVSEDAKLDEEGTLAYPRPISEPPSPQSSRGVSPATSETDSTESEEPQENGNCNGNGSSDPAK